MPALTEWVRQLVVLVFVVSAAQLLLPTDNMRPYVRFVLGLVIVAALLTSMFELTTFDFDFEALFVTGYASDFGNGPADKGQALTAAALGRLQQYDVERTHRHVERIAATVLGSTPEHVVVDVDAGDGSRSIVVVRRDESGIGDEEAARLLGELLGIPPEHVIITSNQGGGSR